MEARTSRKSVWVLTGEAFEGLLRSLDADRERAGEKYEQTRRKLIEFFEARGCHAPVEHADETINRVARKIYEGEEIQDVARYFYGVARLLWMELLRERAKNPVPLDAVAPPSTRSTKETEEIEEERAERERRVGCFETCLEQFTPDNRTFIIAYYREEKGAKIESRKAQADALGVSLNALRLRACRIKSILEKCVKQCVEQASKK